MSQQLCYNIVIRLEEDLHSGTGTGSGSLDAIQITGRDSLPVIRATHLRGLLRTAGRFLCEIGHCSQEEYQRLFSKPGEWQSAALLMQSLRFQSESQEQADWSLQWTNTSRKLNSRTPKEDTLRTLEYVKAGSRFYGQWILTDASLANLLRDCLQQVTHLGSSRSRGSGRISVECFEQVIEDKTKSLPKPDSEQTRLRLVLRNLEPLCLPITGYAGNIIPSACYIRGQQLFGALVAYALRGQNKSMAESLLAPNNQVQIGNAYPLPEQVSVSEDCEQWMLLPFPLNIYHEKPKPQTSPEQPWWTWQTGKMNYLGERNEQDQFQPKNNEDGEKLKRPGDREFLFRSSTQENWQRYQPKMAVHMRNQTPVEENPYTGEEKREDDLFSEEEILEDTRFLCDIVFPRIELAQAFVDAFEDLLNGQTWLSVGRGGRPIVVERAIWLKPEPVSSSTEPNTQKLTILLTSDLIARSKTLGFYEALDIKVLQELLRKEINTDKLKYQVYQDTTTVRGFNYLTRLPKAPVLAIRRGSAIEISGATDEIKNLRQALQQKMALGERINEGFGRFKLDLIFRKNHQPDKAELKPNVRIGTQESVLVHCQA